jgi:transposase
MHATTIAVDLAKDIFEIVGADSAGRIVDRRRLIRRHLERLLNECPAGTEVVMEACGTAHHWGRYCERRGLVARLLPPQYVRPYVRRNKTDRTDAEALLEARRCGSLHPVPVKSADEQALRALHDMRAQWQSARTARLNAIRGFLREQGIGLPVGAAVVRRRVPALLEDAEQPVPRLLRQLLHTMLEELSDLEGRLAHLDRQLRQLADTDPDAQRLQTVPGVGPIVATSLLGAVPQIRAFASGRHFASWLGLTPRETTSGSHRRLGRITKRGDVYVRTMLTHGARSVVLNARRRARVGRHDLTPLQRWAVAVAHRRGHNTAVIAVANKLARILWAVWRSDRADSDVARPAMAG